MNTPLTYYHTMREDLEALNAYHLFLQEQGLLTEDVYFGRDNIVTDLSCQISYKNDCGRFIPVKGFPAGYSI